MDSMEMVSRIGHGDRTTEEMLVKKYWRGLVIMLQGLTNNRQLAEDIAQEALLIVIKRLRNEGIEKPDSLTSYLYQTARYEFLGGLRKKNNQLRLIDSAESVIDNVSSIEETWTAAETRALVTQYIRKLPVRRDREILLRFYVNEQPKQEICDALSLTPIHFDRVISRARNRFYELVKHRKHELLD